MIKNVIFDIGGVLLEYRWLDMLCIDHGMEKERAVALGSRLFDDQLWESMDLGIVTVNEAIEEYCKKNPEYSDDISWFLKNAELMRVNRTAIWDRFPQLKEKGYKIYILSNYSKELLAMHTKDSYFWKYVDGEVVSYQIQVIKPLAQIYRHILKKYSLTASECIFYDDRKENVEGAIKEGLNSVLVVSEAQLADEIDKLPNLNIE